MQADIPTAVGIVSTATPDAMETDGKLTTPTQKKYYIDCTNIHVPREGMELTHPLSDGMGKEGLGERTSRSERGVAAVD